MKTASWPECLKWRHSPQTSPQAGESTGGPTSVVGQDFILRPIFNRPTRRRFPPRFVAPQTSALPDPMAVDSGGARTPADTRSFRDPEAATRVKDDSFWNVSGATNLTPCGRWWPSMPVAHALVRAASPLLATPPDFRQPEAATRAGDAPYWERLWRHKPWWKASARGPVENRPQDKILPHTRLQHRSVSNGLQRGVEGACATGIHRNHRPHSISS